MRDLLVCYLLGELSDAQKQDLEAKLAVDARLRDELERLRQCLLPEDAPTSSAPPRNLLDRTVKCVSDSQSGDGKLSVVEPAVSRCSFSLVDGIVAVGVVFAISMLLLPALRESRDISRRTTCQENLRQIGIGFVSFAEANGGYFPQVEPHQPAGIYAVRLAESGHIDQQQLIHLLVCPSSPLADALQQGNLILHLPQLSDVAEGGQRLCVQTRSTMGGSYAVRSGYFQGPVYIAIRNKADCRSPILIDAPSRENLAGTSPHHGGGGQNVLYEDGHVDFVVGYLVPAWENSFFLNNDEQPAAGREWNDVVMLPSDTKPWPMMVPVATPR